MVVVAQYTHFLLCHTGHIEMVAVQGTITV